MTPHQRSSEKLKKLDILKIGCWNVQSLGKPTKFNGKLLNVIETMRLKNLSLLALSDVQGSSVLELEESTIIFSGLDEKRSGNQRGVAVVLRNKMRMGLKKKMGLSALYPKDF